jgi:hypothetical protein
LKAAWVRGINDRRTPFSSLLHYLHKGHQRYEHLDPALSFEHLSKSAIVNAIVRLNELLNRQTDEPLPFTCVSSNSDSIDSTVNLSLKEKLDMAIFKGKLKFSKDLSNTIRKEIVVFEDKGTRGTYLQNSYKYLKTMKLTSDEPKREVAAFSPNYDHLLRMILLMSFVSDGHILEKKKRKLKKKSVILI